MLRRAIASGLIATLVSCGRPWPVGVANVSDPALAAHRTAVGSIDVLPVDVEFWAEPAYQGDLDQVRIAAENHLASATLTALAQRNYAFNGAIDWTGHTDSGVVALPEPALLATMNVLASYGEAADKAPGRLPVPYLPARLGDATGADATLYVGGWAYVANHHTSTGTKIAEGIAIGVLVVVAIAAIVVIAAAIGKGGGGHGGGGGGGGHGGGGAGGGGVAHAGGGGAIGGHVSASGGHVGMPSGNGLRGGSSSGGVGPGGHIGGRVASPPRADAWNRMGDPVDDHVEWADEPGTPHAGDPQMYVEMTLVDNHSGLVLWHAHQVFPADASHGDDVAHAARSLLASLPAR